MKISICLPYMKAGLSREIIKTWCQRVDEGPFASLSCGERIIGPTLEMRNVLAAAAAWTERVRIVPSLYVLPMHSPVWAAKEIATLDVLSEGRVTVTVGVGGREQDYQAVGAPFTRRFQRMDDHMAVMKSVWQGQPPVAGGDIVGPEPVQVGGPPIWAGAMGPKSIARASQWADGLYAFSMDGQRHEIERMLNKAEQAWQESEREMGPQRIGGFWYSLSDCAEANLKDYVYQYMKFTGDEMANAFAKGVTRHNEESVWRAIDDMEAAGCEELFMVPATAELSEIDRLLEILQKRG